LTPVQGDGTVQPISKHDQSLIGRFKESVDDTGTTHLRGVNRRTGEIFHITVNPYGRVEGSVGTKVVTFQVASAN
jgi:hypothetical protein